MVYVSPVIEFYQAIQICKEVHKNEVSKSEALDALKHRVKEYTHRDGLLASLVQFVG